MFSPKPDSIKPNIHQSDFVTDSNHIEDRKGNFKFNHSL